MQHNKNFEINSVYYLESHKTQNQFESHKINYHLEDLNIGNQFQMK